MAKTIKNRDSKVIYKKSQPYIPPQEEVLACTIVTVMCPDAKTADQLVESFDHIDTVNSAESTTLPIGVTVTYSTETEDEAKEALQLARKGEAIETKRAPTDDESEPEVEEASKPKTKTKTKAKAKAKPKKEEPKANPFVDDDEDELDWGE